MYGFNFLSMLSVTFEFSFKHEQVPGSASGKEPTCQCKDMRDVGLISRLGRPPLEEGMATHSNILAWRIP